MKDAILDARINQPEIIERKDHQVVFEFIEGKSLESFLLKTFLDGDKARYLECTDLYYDLLLNSFLVVKEFHLTPDNEVFLKGVDLNFIEREGVYFPHAFLDLVMDNILVTADEKYYCIDYEWIIPASFPVAFVFYRSLSNFYGFKYGEFDVERFLPLADLMNRYGISSYHLEQYAKIEENYQRCIVGDHLYNRSRYLKKRVSLDDLMPFLDGTQQRLIQTYQENIRRLTQTYQENIRRLDSIQQRLIQAYQENIRQLNRAKDDLNTAVRQGEKDRERLIEQEKDRERLIEQIKDRERLIEQVKAKDDLIARLHSSYSMKIGKTILFPFKYIRDRFFTR